MNYELFQAIMSAWIYFMLCVIAVRLGAILRAIKKDKP